MSHHCHDPFCTHESHHHHQHSAETCDCCCHRTCDCPCHHAKGKYADQLLEMADSAWMEVIKDLVKEEIMKQSSDHIKKLAKLVAQSNQKRWTEKLAEKRAHQEFEEQLNKLMTGK